MDTIHLYIHIHTHVHIWWTLVPTHKHSYIIPIIHTDPLQRARQRADRGHPEERACEEAKPPPVPGASMSSACPPTTEVKLHDDPLSNPLDFGYDGQSPQSHPLTLIWPLTRPITTLKGSACSRSATVTTPPASPIGSAVLLPHRCIHLVWDRSA